MRERERERQRQRDRDRETGRQGDRETEIETEGGRSGQQEMIDTVRSTEKIFQNIETHTLNNGNQTQICIYTCIFKFLIN